MSDFLDQWAAKVLDGAFVRTFGVDDCNFPDFPLREELPEGTKYAIWYPDGTLVCNFSLAKLMAEEGVEEG